VTLAMTNAEPAPLPPPSVDPDALPGPARLSWWVPLLLAAAGVTLMVLRVGDGPMARWLMANVSFEALPLDAQAHVDDLLLVPAASVLVVFCRITLGLRMLGPFRPILIGLAFYQTGVVPGTLFIAVIMAVVALLHPRLNRGAVPYFGRLTVLLAIVVIAELFVLLVGTHLRSAPMMEAAVFPIIVLCLSADGFARVLGTDGVAQAVWRGAVTVLLAVLISTLGNVDVIADFLFAFPELVLVEIAAILVISTRMDWGWFATPGPAFGEG